ncbi:MAG: 23S rRNA (pseudouridine(1915)-N(3))-methyltransferase RlmH [Azospirillum sp.]|nr:23S rRNA (pseudouridine(1915)-N(3))-methyltransferase RlmH [Azospirillum sp.]
MRLALVAVGRARGGPERSLFEQYAARLRPPLTLREVEAKGRPPALELRRQEGQLLLAAVPEGATVVALDPRGIGLTSEALAARIGTWRDRGVADLAFLIGGADGLDEGVRQRADLVLGLGPLTWPHLLVRGMLAEQLYRCQQILAGHPYHRASP